MTKIREHKHKQLAIRLAAAGLMRANLTLGTARMFVGIINVLRIKENAP